MTANDTGFSTGSGAIAVFVGTIDAVVTANNAGFGAATDEDDGGSAGPILPVPGAIGPSGKSVLTSALTFFTSSCSSTTNKRSICRRMVGTVTFTNLSIL